MIESIDPWGELPYETLLEVLELIKISSDCSPMGLLSQKSNAGLVLYAHIVHSRHNL